MAPLEPYEKIYVSAAFLDTEHGRLGCETCHGGNPQDPNWQTAHEGIVKDPTFPDPANACGQCHDEIAATAAQNLHYTLATFDRTLLQRMSPVEAIQGEKKVPHQIILEKCTMCGACFRACPACAVQWEKKQPASIDKSKCVKCMSCIAACRFDAIY